VQKRVFSPGFRCSALDAVVLAGGILASFTMGRQGGWMGFVIPYVVGHFFLFCNVFRIPRRLELLWAVVFVALALLTVTSGRPGWLATIAVSFTVTVVVIGLALRRPSYHGIGWRRLNPELHNWWQASSVDR
jgi:hypothetical protein